MDQRITSLTRRYGLLEVTTSLIVIALSIITIAGWILGNEKMTSLGIDYIAMAPSTAILFLIISLPFIGTAVARNSQIAGILSLSGGIIITSFSLPLLILGFFKIHPAFIHLGFGPPDGSGSPLIGHMSPVTAFLFSILGIALIINRLTKKSIWTQWISPILSLIILLLGLIMLIGYVSGNPFLYTHGQIPVALNTAICFVLLGINVSLESTLGIFYGDTEVSPGSNRSVHLFSLGLALIITGILFFGYLNVQTIFRNLQEEVKYKMLMITRIKQLEIKSILDNHGDSTLFYQHLDWPLIEPDPGTISVFSRHSSFEGWTGEEGLTEYTDSKGVTFEICFVSIDQSDWIIACQIKKTVAFKPIIQQFIQVTTLFFCLLILTITTLILISRQSKLRFYKEQVESAGRLQMAEDQFRNAFEHSSVGKTMIYRDGSFHVNKAFAEMLGYSVDELNQKKWIDITAPEDEEISLNEMNSLLGGEKESTRFEKRYVHKNGETIWIDLQSYLQRDKEGNPLYFITSTRNITDYKKLQEQLIRSKEEAEKSNKLKDAFIANISHEIRTPLNAILGFTDLMRDELEEKGNHDFDNYFDIIRTSGSRLTRTVDMILNVSRLQVGEFEPQQLPVQISSLVSDLVSEYKLAAQKKGIQMEFVNEAGTSVITGDEYCYTHSISNLVDNAVKYTQSGQIILKLYRNQENSLCLDVADTGIGISREFIDEIFNPFTQEDSGSTRKFEGIGLGLSIAQRLLVLTKASIAVNSEKGRGTVFTITF